MSRRGKYLPVDGDIRTVYRELVRRDLRPRHDRIRKDRDAQASEEAESRKGETDES